MKKNYILLTILLSVLFMLSGCNVGVEKIVLSEYHQCGETWSIFGDQSEYNVSFDSRNDNTMEIDITIVKTSVNYDKIYVYSKGYQVIYNGEFCYESIFSMPMLIPVGVYELPVEDNKVSFEIVTEKENFKGYIKITLEGLSTYGGAKQVFRFDVN